MALAARKERIELLRSTLHARFGNAGAGLEPQVRGPCLGSGWEALDLALPHGGLAPGDSAWIDAGAGAGALALASSWARQAVREGEPVAVLDAKSQCLPHPWIEPPDARAPIWVVSPQDAQQVWPALDMMLRSGAFGLVLLLDPPPAPRGAGARIRQLLERRRVRLLFSGAAPLSPTLHIQMALHGVDWRTGPLGDEPAMRSIQVRCSPQPGMPAPLLEISRADHLTDRMHPRARVGDRRGGQRPREAPERP